MNLRRVSALVGGVYDRTCLYLFGLLTLTPRATQITLGQTNGYYRHPTSSMLFLFWDGLYVPLASLLYALLFGVPMLIVPVLIVFRTYFIDELQSLFPKPGSKK